MTFRAMSSTKKCQYQKSDLSKNSLNVKICPITLEVCIPVSHLIMYEMGYIISLYLFSVKYRIDLENIVIGQQRKAISFRSCITRHVTLQGVPNPLHMCQKIEMPYTYHKALIYGLSNENGSLIPPLENKAFQTFGTYIIGLVYPKCYIKPACTNTKKILHD